MKWLKGCIAAFRFLTIIPMPTSIGSSRDELSGAALFFPVVGLVLGLAAGFAAWLFWSIFPPFVASVLLVFLLLSFSGALHLDGLADTADGFFSARDRTATLEIMRDSRIGVMGVAAVLVMVLIKVASLSALSRADAIHTAVLMPIAGRCALVVMMALLPYVRHEGGLGTCFFKADTIWPALSGVLIILLSGFATGRLPGLAIALSALVTVMLFSLYCLRKIGGATGDTLGAACEITESVTAFCFMTLSWQAG